MNRHCAFCITLGVSSLLGLNPTSAQSPPLSPDSFRLTSGDVSIDINSSGGISDVYFMNRSLPRTNFDPLGLLGSKTISSVVGIADSVVVTGVVEGIEGINGAQEFQQTYRFREGSNTLEVATTLPSVAERTLVYNELGISNDYVDRVPVVLPSGREYASILAKTTYGRDAWDFAIVAGTSNQDARIYGGVSVVGGGLPPFDLVRDALGAPPITDPQQLLELGRDSDGGGRMGRLGAATIVDPSTTPQTLAVTYSFGSSPQQAFDEYKSLYNAELAPLPLESRLSSRGAELRTGEPGGGSLFVTSVTPEGLAVVQPVYVHDASANAEWTVNSFELTPADREFTINSVEAMIRLPNVWSRTITIDGIPYFVEYKNLIVKVSGQDLSFTQYRYSPEALLEGIIDPSDIQLVGGTVEATPTFGPPYYTPSTLEPAPIYFRDFGVDPLESQPFPGDLAGFRPRITIAEADLFYPENVVMLISPNAAFSPFDQLPITLGLISPSPIAVGVPEISACHLVAACALAFAWVGMVSRSTYDR